MHRALHVGITQEEPPRILERRLEARARRGRAHNEIVHDLDMTRSVAKSGPNARGRARKRTRVHGSGRPRSPRFSAPRRDETSRKRCLSKRMQDTERCSFDACASEPRAKVV